jgi:hypothetical protein
MAQNEVWMRKVMKHCCAAASAAVLEAGNEKPASTLFSSLFVTSSTLTQRTYRWGRGHHESYLSLYWKPGENISKCCRRAHSSFLRTLNAIHLLDNQTDTI